MKLGPGVAALAVVGLLLAGCSQDTEAPPAAAPAATAPGEAAPGTAPATAPPADGGAAPVAPAVTQAPEAAPGPVARSGSANPAIARPGETILVTGGGWPAGQLVTASLCGNNFLQGSSDCSRTAVGQTTARADGTLAVNLTVALPPKPCPCIIRMATQADALGVDVPFEVVGAPTAPPQAEVTSRRLNVDPRLTGSGPLTAYFGGTAKRELLLTITNVGSAPLVGLPVSLTVGKGDDPTDPLLSADGQPITIDQLEVGASTEIRVPVVIDAPAFGQYTVKGLFVGVDAVSVDGEPNDAGDETFSTTTTTYPWGLILIGWLLLQIPLLGLYKRRPVVVEPAPAPAPVEYAPDYTYAGPAVEAGFAAGVFDAAPPMAGTMPPYGVPAPPPPPSGFRIVGAAPPPPPAPPVPPLPQPGLPGVNDLRSLLDG